MKQPSARFIAAFVLLMSLGPIRAEVVDTQTVLLPFDPDFLQDFGYSVAISGHTAVVGAPESALRIGSAYVYHEIGSNWVQQQKLVPPQATTNNLVGISVAIEDNLLAIGAPGFGEPEFDSGLTNTIVSPGMVFLFQRDTNGVFQPRGWLRAPDAQNGDRFGVSIAMSDQSMVVGAPFHNDFGATNNGSIYVFDFTSLGWQLAAKITPGDLTNHSNFGQRVAINGSTLIAGASNSIVATGAHFTVTSPGAAYVYHRKETNQFTRPWILDQKLVPTNAVARDQFGFSVAVSGDTALVGAPFSTNGGSVYAYQRNITNWTFQTQLVSSNLTNGDNFGFSISMLGNQALIGASGQASNDFSGLGAAYIFELIDTNWSQRQELLPLHPGTNFEFGFSTAIGAQGLLVGTPAAVVTRGTGVAYAFTASQAIFSITNATATPSILIAPRGTLVPVTIDVQTTGTNVTSKIIAVNSNQPFIEGSSTPPFVITGDLTLLLQASLGDNINVDRVYNVIVQSTDAFGNSATTTVPVIVPHNLGGVPTVPATATITTTTPFPITP